METVLVGDVGNPNDPATGAFWGSVAYPFRMGKYEVTVGQYTAFLNAVAINDTYFLYNTKMATDLNVAGISRRGAPGSYSYQVIGSANHPISYVSWGDAARFANRLHNGQTTTTEDGAYTLDGATSGSALTTVTRNASAAWFIPSEQEWYKAAYHRPSTEGGDSDDYWTYPTRTNDYPYSDQPPGSDAPIQTNSANFHNDDSRPNGFNDGYAVTGSQTYSSGRNYLTDVGAYTLSPGPYGTFDQGGNVVEWNETLLSGSYRAARGGSWNDTWLAQLSTFQLSLNPTHEDSGIGFRVASLVPEPGAMLLVIVCAGLIALNRCARCQPGLLLAPVVVFTSLDPCTADAFRTVALSGQQAPGVSSSQQFANFNLPVIDGSGKTAFLATLAGPGVNFQNAQGIWSEGGGSLTLVARELGPIPGGPPDALFGNLEPPVINNAGDIAFHAGPIALAGPGLSDGIFAQRGGDLQVVAFWGAPAMGTPRTAAFASDECCTFWRPVLNNSGQTAFAARVAYVNDGLNFQWPSLSALWSERSDALHLVAINGGTTPIGGTIGIRGPDAPAFNDRGETAFRAEQRTPTSVAGGIWIERAGVTAPVILGDATDAEGANGLDFFSFEIPVINNVGQVAFALNRSGAGYQQGIWSTASGALEPVAKSGQPAPGTLSGVQFDEAYGSFRSPVLNDRGQTAFVAQLVGSGVDSTNRFGIWVERPGEGLGLLARTGSQSPGVPAGAVYSSFGMGALALNNAGQIAFASFLTGGGVTTGNSQGIWATNRNGSLQLIVRSGEPLEVAPGDVRILRSLSVHSINADGHGGSFLNSAGQVAFRGTFTDGSSGIFVSNAVAVPEPATLSLLGLGLAGAWLAHSKRQRVRCAPLLSAVVWLFCGPETQAATLRTVALTGQQAPGAPSGVTYSRVGNPALNAAGQAAFWASLAGAGINSGNAEGIWSEGAGALSLMARTGSPAPGTPNGVTFSYVSAEPAINNLGRVAFHGGLTGPGVVSANSEGVWSNASGNLALVARKGSHAPGTPVGVNFGNNFSGLDVLLNDAGQTAFLLPLVGSGVNSSNALGIWSGSPGNLALVARTGDPAAGTGRNFTGLWLGALDSNGHVVIKSFLAGLGDGALHSGGPDDLHLIKHTGDQAPGTGPIPATFRAVDYFPDMNAAGHAAFNGALNWSATVNSGNDQGIWSDRNGNIELVVRKGARAPGLADGVTLSGFESPLINNSDQIAAIAGLAGAGVNASNNAGVFVERAGIMSLVVRKGDHAPGTPPGVVFESFPFQDLAFNSAGQIAFWATLSGAGVNSSNFGGLWATDSQGQLHLIARKGDSLEVVPGDYRTVAFLFDVGGNATGDGRRSAFNDRGQYAFSAWFTDGSTGVFVSDVVAVPEPAILSLPGLALAGTWLSRSKLRLVRCFSTQRSLMQPISVASHFMADSLSRDRLRKL
jgi:formylglycine-generating enzyme required for sulfatase activity